MRFTAAAGQSLKSALVALMLVFSMVILTGGAEAARVSVRTKADLNVRTCPSTSCQVIGVLPAGTCEIAHRWAAGRSWVEITFKGRRAYVSAKYLRRGC